MLDIIKAMSKLGPNSGATSGGYKREISIANTTHQSFWDYLVLGDDLIVLGILSQVVFR
jgi:hypothetical protein